MIAAHDLILLLGAGLLAGAMNAVVGGGTFVSLPALTAIGLPGTVANASSSVALLPGAMASAWAYRRDMQPVEGVSIRAMGLLSLAGGAVGAVLLLATTEAAFDLIIPWLLLIATVTLAAGPRLARALARVGLKAGPPVVLGAQFFLGIYGGYFGGAVGLMMLAAWSLLTEADIAALTPLRTLMLAAANAVAVLVFIVSGNVSWPAALAVMAGAVAGGYLGAQVGRRLPAVVLRTLVVVIAVGATAIFFWRAYG
ncbi:sulfite exporter TauE/SafE family protein [Phenylobacterium sp.]|uniref:sulfite exporter TauE/SafE family protein n=1 Tax=Phenylobacterium sp. TaxID=1871053 RepID=UPI0025DF900A|nr:sulfite exporter TauE/SafE family protein [Phenylobacterium sp.]